MEKSGAEIIVSYLEMQGIKTIFGIPGSSNLPLYDALSKSSIKHILVGHEQAAGFMAQGFTRSTGKTAVCLATSGPGLTNLITAVADAFLDSVPIVAITGQVPTPLIGSQAFQELDTESLVQSITKKCFVVRQASDLYQKLPMAFSIAQSGRPGPVWIDIPKDIQTQIVACESFENSHMDEDPVNRPDFNQTETAASLINAAKRPLLLVGGGLIEANASVELMYFSDKTGIPIASTLRGLGAVDIHHANYLGMIGMHGNKELNEWTSQVDLLIALGVRFGDRTTGQVHDFFPNAQTIHVDIDPRELNKTKHSQLSIAGDVKQFLMEMDRHCFHQRKSDFHRNKHMNTFEAQSPRRMMEYIAGNVPEDTIITTDVGQHQMWVAQYYPFSKPRTFITSAGLGTMGFGLPAALGASVAFPDKKIVCITGDGSFLMNLQELATLKKMQSNITILLFNNRGLGLVRQQQRLFFQNNLYASDFEDSIGFHTIATGFGIHSISLDAYENPETGIKEALSYPGPCLLDIPIEKEWNVFPIVPPGASIKTMIDEFSFQKQSNYINTNR